jgi:hypothetical protein
MLPAYDVIEKTNVFARVPTAEKFPRVRILHFLIYL